MTSSESVAVQPILVRRWQVPSRWRPWLRMLRDPIIATAVLILVVFGLCAIFAPLLAPYDPYKVATNPGEFLQGPSPKHLFGTDVIGRDLFSRMLYGARVSLGVGVAATALGAVVGVLLGLIAGFFRGILDEVIMRCK